MVAPVVLSDSYDALLTTTARNYMPKLRNNISKGNKVVAWLMDRGRMRGVDGGERVQVPLLYGLNSTADIYSGYGALRVDPQDGITSAFYTWCQLSVSVTISRREERQNSGQSRLLGLLQSKMTQAEVSLKELLNNCIVSWRISSGASSTDGAFVARVGSMDSGATGPLPLTALIDATPSRSRTDIGAINPNTYSWWQNQMKSSGATTYAGLKTEMTDLYTLCAKGAGGSPDLGICDRLLWVTYFNSLQNQERYLRTDERTVNVLGGSQALAFFDAALTWDEVVPDVKTNADVVDGIGTVSKSTLYFINSESMEWIYDTETNFINTPFVRPENQDARVSQILFMGTIGTNNRRKNGVLKNVSQSIVA
jgi:hypothetical protein